MARTTARAVPVALLVLALATVMGVSVAALGYYVPGRSGPGLIVATAAAWALFAAAIGLLRRVPDRAVGALVLIGGLLVGGAAMAGPPNTSTDSARYAWDGIVQAHGVSPYRYAPTAPQLEGIRPDWLFPAPVREADGSLGCAGARIQTSHEPGTGTGTPVCTALNRGSFRTIYPPAAEIVFAGVRLITGPTAEYWPLQLLGLLLTVAVTVVLLRALRARALDRRWAALWAWCPLVASEAVTNSHVDVLGALLLLLATTASSRGRGWRAGLALGAAMSAKLIPAIGAPALLGRRPWRVIVGAVGVFALLYVPYLLLSGVGVLGYLPRYLGEEGYENGSRFALIGAVLPGRPAIAAAAVLLAVTAVLVWRKTDPDRPWLGEAVMIGVTLVVVSPRYPWYALLLVPMIAMTGRWEWLAVALALGVRQLVPRLDVFQVALLLAVLAVLAVTLRRAGRGGPRRAWNELRHPLRRPSAVRDSASAAADASPTLGA